MVCELLFLAVLFGAAVSDWSERMIPDHFPVLLLLSEYLLLLRIGGSICLSSRLWQERCAAPFRCSFLPFL